jgi:hypothetical protein
MACLGKYLNGVDPANITSLEELLEKTDLKSVHELLKQQGIATLEAFMMLTPSAIETMGVTKGLRIRLLRAAEMMRQARPVEFPREEDALMSDTGEADTMPPKHNSTSSLYIDSTISSPDFTRVVFCVSILVHDLIVEGEASHQAKLAAGLTPTNPCALFRPKEIFVTGKRQREEDDTSGRGGPLARPAAPAPQPTTFAVGASSSSAAAQMMPPPPPRQALRQASSSDAVAMDCTGYGDAGAAASTTPSPPLPRTVLVEAPPHQPPLWMSSSSSSSSASGGYNPHMDGRPKMDDRPNMGSSACADSTSCAANAAEPMDTEIPGEDEICQALQQMHALMRMHPGCLVVAMIYIERLRRGTHSDLLVSTWQPTLFAAVILAQKVWEDGRHYRAPKDYVLLNAVRSACPPCTPLTCPPSALLNAVRSACPPCTSLFPSPLRRPSPAPLPAPSRPPTSHSQTVTKAQMAQLERDFLQAIDYNVGIKAAVYTEWYFKICTFAERLSAPLRPLGKDVATLLEIRGAAFEEKILAERPQSLSDPTLSDSCKAPPAPRSRIVLS